MEIGNDVITMVDNLVDHHNFHYKSVNFGEDLIKEMIMSSIFGIPLSAKVNLLYFNKWYLGIFI